MARIFAFVSVVVVSLSVFANVNQGFNPKSAVRIHYPFANFESCEANKVEVIGVDPITQKSRDISVTVYRPRPQTGRSVLLIPPTGGVSALEHGYAERLCNKGVEAWVITEWAPQMLDFKLELDLGSHDRAARQALAAVRHVIRQMPGSIGILGTSVGAIIGSVAAAIEPRVRAAVLIAGGADLASIFQESDLEAIQNLRQKRMEMMGFNSQSYEASLQKAIRIDPKYFGPQMRTKRIGVVISLEDETVPVRNQELLEEISGAERIAQFESGHFMSIIKTAFLKSHKIENFFLDNL